MGDEWKKWEMHTHFGQEFWKADTASEPCRIVEDDIKMDLKDFGYDSVDCVARPCEHSN